ncbi:hypothetical protein SAMN05661044_01799 [Olivibacter domesticus]|uniref:Uncharacterized protein n=2 Tax=Olivibacter domesticus TaxID=407022 RepID=A0A1H7LX92_OLID1|nr:hypothetical protein SAMN05661044_01799 [Olivibacter domesticus]
MLSSLFDIQHCIYIFAKYKYPDFPMPIFRLASKLGLPVNTDNIGELPIIIINAHIFISQSETEGLFDINNTCMMEWYSVTEEIATLLYHFNQNQIPTP